MNLDNITQSVPNIIADLPNTTLANETGLLNWVSTTAASTANSVTDFVFAIGDTSYSAVSSVSTKFSDAAGSAAEYLTTPIKSTFVDYTKNGTYMGDGYTYTTESVSNIYAGTTTGLSNIYEYSADKVSNGAAFAAKVVTDNALSLKSSGAAVGGFMAINSTMNLLQQRPNIDRATEIKKIVAGTTLAAVSLYQSGEGELAGVLNLALGAGLATAMFKTATFAKQTVHIQLFTLKSKDASPELQNVIFVPANVVSATA